MTINNEEVAAEETYRSNVAGFGSPIGRGGFFRGRGGGFRFARGNFRPWTEHVICKVNLKNAFKPKNGKLLVLS